MSRLTVSTAWVEQFLAGEVPTYVKVIPDRLQAFLRAYLLYLRIERKRATSTLNTQGRSLVNFFAWITSNAPQVTLDAICPDHIAHYLEHFQSDGRVQGRDAKREDHKKTVRTMYSKVCVLRAFFAWAKLKQHCRVNPAEPFHFEWGPKEAKPLPEAQVAVLLRAWTDPATHPRTAAVGLLCLVYGLTTAQIATLRLSDVNLTKGTFHGLAVPVPIPQWLRPVLERYLAWRSELLDEHPCDNFVVTRLLHKTPPSHSFIFQILKPYDVNVRQLRDTALAETVQHGHLKLLTIYGLGDEGIRRFEALARLVQNTRKVDPKPNLW